MTGGISMSIRLLAFAAVAALTIVAAIGSDPEPAAATHSWGRYHWAIRGTEFTLQLGDSLTTPEWKSSLNVAAADWSTSDVLNTTVVSSSNTIYCTPRSGRIEVCNGNYGENGWLGIAQIWPYADGHIYQATTKLNDWYFTNTTWL